MGCLDIVGAIFGLGALGYVALKLVEFIVPHGWVAFTNNEFAFVVMGGGFALIDLVVDRGKAKAIGKALEQVGKENG